MTTITTNRIGLDIVDIQVEQTGQPQTDIFFQEPVLDQERDYVLAVSELTVPLTSEPMVTDNTLLRNTPLLEIFQKRNAVGAGGMLARGHVASTIANAKARFLLKQYMIVTPVDIIQSLSRFVYTFQQFINGAGGIRAGAVYSVSLLASPSGILRIRGNHYFWNDYVFQFTKYSQELLGYNQELLGLAWPAASAIYTTTDLVTGGANTYIHSDHAAYATSGAFEIVFQYSAFRYIESRLRIEVDADLAIPSNILVENGIHKLHYNIASYALPQKYEGQASISNDPVVHTSVTHTTHFYTGNTIIKSKETPTTDWYKLLSAANVQNMRLHIFILRRAWDVANNTWILTRNKLTMSNNSTWFMTLKFVQQF